MPQDQLRNAIDVLRARLQQELETQLTALTKQQDQALESVRKATEAEAERRWTGKLDGVRSEWMARLESEVAAARGEAEKRFVTEVARLRAESERAVADAAVQARLQAEKAAERAAASARAEAERAMAEAVAQVRTEAEQASAEALATLRAETERNAAQVTARLRAEVEQASAVAVARVREEAEQEIEAERQRGIAVLDTERERWSGEIEAERQRATQALDAERRRLDLERQAERQRFEADRVSERQRFDSERQQFRAERQRFEAERQQLALERDRFIAEAQEREAMRPLAAVGEATPVMPVIDEQAQAAAVAAAENVSRLETELEAEREHVARLDEALQNANDSLRNIGTALERERQERAVDHAARIRAEEAMAASASGTAARAAERDAQLASVERLLGALRSLDHAGSLTQILDGVLQAAAAAAPRAALFIVSGDHLQGLKASGFEHVDIGSERLPNTGNGLLALAVERREAVATTDVRDAVAPEFALLPANRAALAVPLTIGGEPVAVLYADDGIEPEQTAPAAWPEAVQILVSHAAACLAHLTATRAAQAMRYATSPANDEGSAQRYARLLVSEIKLYHEAAVRVGRENRDLLDRLRPEIDRARKLYEERVPASAGERHTYFQQELVRTLADGNAELLGEPA